MHPTDFWRSHPEEFWMIYDGKLLEADNTPRPEYCGMSKATVRELYAEAFGDIGSD